MVLREAACLAQAAPCDSRSKSWHATVLPHALATGRLSPHSRTSPLRWEGKRNRPCDARLPLLPWPSASCSHLSGSLNQQAAVQAEARPQEVRQAAVPLARRAAELPAAEVPAVRGRRGLAARGLRRLRAPSVRGRWLQALRAPREPRVAPPQGRMELGVAAVAAGRPEPPRAVQGRVRAELAAPVEQARTPVPRLEQARWVRGLARPGPVALVRRG